MNNLNKRKSSTADVLVVGVALFAMFFGSGNLIFPPDLGIRGGSDWFVGYLAYFAADAVLAIVSIYGMMRVNGDLTRLTSVIGKGGSLLINTIVILCIGPLLAIPRNASVTYELGLTPLFHIDPASKMALAIFSVAFFLIVFALTVRPSHVIDIIGKYLTPLLVLSILIMIIVGLVHPGGSIGVSHTETVFKDGIYSGYQTLDLMAGLYFAMIIITTVKGKNYTDQKSVDKVVGKSAVVACGILFVVYGGLAYLGATTGTIWTNSYMAGNINQAGLLANITQELLGGVGMSWLAVIVCLACLTTAIGLCSATAEYFSKLLEGKVSYRTALVCTCIVSGLLCNIGLSEIISVSAPLLMLVYPVVLYLTVVVFLRKQVRKQMFYYLGAAVTLIVSALTVLTDSYGVSSVAWIHSLPLNDYGFNWILPAVLASVIGLILPGKKIPEEL